MGCGCTGMRGLGAFGAIPAAGTTTPTVWYDYNPAGAVRCLRDEALAEMKSMLGKVQALVAIDPSRPDFVAVTGPTQSQMYAGYKTMPWADWVAAKVKEGKKVAAAGTVKGQPQTEFPSSLASMDLLTFFASPDEHGLTAMPYAPAIFAGYTPFPDPSGGGGGDGGGAQAASVWSGPVPWLIGGAVILGIGAFALTRKK